MQALTQSSQDRKAVLIERLASFSKDIAILRSQWKTSLDEMVRSRLQGQIDNLLDQMERAENELNNLELSESNLNRQYLSLQEDLPKIDFKEAMKIVEGILKQFDTEGGTALFLVEKSHAMAGTYCVARIRESLGTSTKKCPIEFSPDMGADERALLDRLAGYFDVEEVSDNQQYAQAIVKKICESSRGGTTFFIDLWQWDELLCPDQVLSWFLAHFWVPLSQGLQVVSQTYRGVKAIAVIVIDGDLPQECSKLPCYCTLANFDGQKIVKLPLRKWKLKEIQDWLELSPGLPIDKCKARAKKIYEKSENGSPLSVVAALEKETFN
jgi:inactive STAND/Effector-associated domain 9